MVARVGPDVPLHAQVGAVSQKCAEIDTPRKQAYTEEGSTQALGGNFSEIARSTDRGTAHAEPRDQTPGVQLSQATRTGHPNDGACHPEQAGDLAAANASIPIVGEPCEDRASDTADLDHGGDVALGG